jgi:hypothetical protein
VILVDANLLIYSWAEAMPQHEAARAWLDARLNQTARVGMPWPSLLAFVRLVSNPRVFERPSTVSAAWHQVEEWLECDSTWIPAPTDRHSQVLGSLIEGTPMRSNLVPDAHLAALAIEHGLELCSTDGDFARFKGLRWSNPLAAS